METLGGCCQKVKAIRHTPKKMRPAATKLKREMAVVKMGGKVQVLTTFDTEKLTQMNNEI